jgi:uncharacterized membrane protein
VVKAEEKGILRSLLLLVDRLILWLSRHWLLLFNLFFGLYAGLPVLAPLLMTWGWARSANVIYFVYRFQCHQMPSRCFFIGRFQVGICERDLALYGGMCLAGMVYGLLRDRVRPLPVRVWIVLVAPLALDGLTQLLGLRTSNWELRTLSGLLAAGGSVWLVYPHLHRGFTEVEESASSQLGKAEAVGPKGI